MKHSVCSKVASSKHSSLCAILMTGILGFASAGASAGETVTLQIKGEIVPATCTPSLSGGGTVDFGKISKQTLSSTSATVLPAKTVALTVSCDVAAKIALRAIDNKKTSTVAGLHPVSSLTDSANFGLGSVSSKNTGVYNLTLSNGKGDSAVVNLLESVNSGTTWTKSTAMAFTSANWVAPTTATTGTAPVAYKTLTADVTVTPAINKTSDLDLTKEVQLDGSATIEVMYL